MTCPYPFCGRIDADHSDYHQTVCDACAQLIAQVEVIFAFANTNPLVMDVQTMDGLPRPSAEVLSS